MKSKSNVSPVSVISLNIIIAVDQLECTFHHFIMFVS